MDWRPVYEDSKIKYVALIRLDEVTDEATAEPTVSPVIHLGGYCD
jgi:hypothetical protein